MYIAKVRFDPLCTWISVYLISSRYAVADAGLRSRRLSRYASSSSSVDRTEQLAGFRPLALVAPEPGEADRRPQLEEFCALPFGNGDGLTIVPLGRGEVASGVQ